MRYMECWDLEPKALPDYSEYVKNPYQSLHQFVRHGTWGALYIICVQWYTQRALTFQKDALGAFAGLARRIEDITATTEPGRAPMCYGLLTSMEDPGEVDYNLSFSLLWLSKGLKLTRRLDDQTKTRPLFPSWSWSGWCGVITYRMHSVVGADDGIRWFVKFQDETETDIPHLPDANYLEDPTLGTDRIFAKYGVPLGVISLDVLVGTCTICTETPRISLYASTFLSAFSGDTPVPDPTDIQTGEKNDEGSINLFNTWSPPAAVQKVGIMFNGTLACGCYTSNDFDYVCGESYEFIAIMRSTHSVHKFWPHGHK